MPSADGRCTTCEWTDSTEIKATALNERPKPNALDLVEGRATSETSNAPVASTRGLVRSQR